MKNYLEKKIIDDDESTGESFVNKLNLLNYKHLNNHINNTSQADLLEDLDTELLNETVQIKKRNSKKKVFDEKKELNAVRKVKMFYRSCMNESVNDEATSVNVSLLSVNYCQSLF